MFLAGGIGAFSLFHWSIPKLLRPLVLSPSGKEHPLIDGYPREVVVATMLNQAVVMPALMGVAYLTSYQESSSVRAQRALMCGCPPPPFFSRSLTHPQ